jgi:hypothetical protein
LFALWERGELPHSKVEMNKNKLATFVAVVLMILLMAGSVYLTYQDYMYSAEIRSELLEKSK